MIQTTTAIYGLVTTVSNVKEAREAVAAFRALGINEVTCVANGDWLNDSGEERCCHDTSITEMKNTRVLVEENGKREWLHVDSLAAGSVASRIQIRARVR